MKKYDEGLKFYLDSIKDIKVLTPKEEEYLFRNIKVSNNKNKLIESNLKLVVSVAKVFFSKKYESLTFMDLIEAGNIGLIRAINKFDIDKGYKFSTYAVHYIKAEIVKEIYNTDRMIRRPYYYEEKISRKIKEGKASYIENVLSLDEEVSTSLTEDSEPLLFFIKDEKTDIFEDISNFEIKEIINDLLDSLTPRQKEVLLLRYGFNDDKEKTFEETGKILGISREGVRKSELKAFTRIRKETLKNPLY